MKKYKIIFAELDGTLTDTISDKTSIKSFWDVKFRFEVLEKIKQLAPERVLIASNQGKIEGDCLYALSIRVQYVFMALQKYCNCKCSGSCCLTDDKEAPNRKPNTGMLKNLCKEIEDDIDNIKSVSLMIGNTGEDKKCAENFGIDYMDVEDFIKCPNTKNNYKYVDLGLSVKWAICNVGATYPEEYGEYLTFDEAIEKFNKDIGRMPTESEFNELCTKCKWEWVSINGHKGYKITGPNGKSIFLPAAGWRYKATSYGVGMFGNYWSSTLSSSYSRYARSLYFNGSYHYASSYYRSYGQSVRLVIE